MGKPAIVGEHEQTSYNPEKLAWKSAKHALEVYEALAFGSLHKPTIIFELARDLIDEMVEASLAECMGHISLLFGQWIGPDKPVKNVVPQRLQGELHVVLQPAHSPLEAFELLHDPVFQGQVPLGIEIKFRSGSK